MADAAGRPRVTTAPQSSTLCLDIAGERWDVEVPSRWLPHFAAVFRHLATSPDRGCDVHLRCRDRPEPDEAEWARSISRRVASDDGIAVVAAAGRRAHVSRMSIERGEHDRRCGESVLLDPAQETAYLGTNLLLVHIVWRALARGLVPVHAAAVGRDGRCWLVPAAAGAGKSTLAAAALAAGLEVLADDFLLLDPAHRVLHSLYATVRLTPGSHHMVARSFGAGALAVLAERPDDKLLLGPGPATLGSGGGFQRLGALEGILLVERDAHAAVGGAVDAPQALAAFASTLRLLPALGYPAAAAFRAFCSVVRRVPARRLHTCADLRAVVACIDDLMAVVA